MVNFGIIYQFMQFKLNVILWTCSTKITNIILVNLTIMYFQILPRKGTSYVRFQNASEPGKIYPACQSSKANSLEIKTSSSVILKIDTEYGTNFKVDVQSLTALLTRIPELVSLN